MLDPCFFGGIPRYLQEHIRMHCFSDHGLGKVAELEDKAMVVRCVHTPSSMQKRWKTVWSTASRVIGFEGAQNASVWPLCENVPVPVSAQYLRQAQGAEALAHAVFQGEPVLPDSLIHEQH